MLLSFFFAFSDQGTVRRHRERGGRQKFVAAPAKRHERRGVFLGKAVPKLRAPCFSETPGANGRRSSRRSRSSTVRASPLGDIGASGVTLTQRSAKGATAAKLRRGEVGPRPPALRFCRTPGPAGGSSSRRSKRKQKGFGATGRDSPRRSGTPLPPCLFLFFLFIFFFGLGEVGFEASHSAVVIFFFFQSAGAVGGSSSWRRLSRFCVVPSEGGERRNDRGGDVRCRIYST